MLMRRVLISMHSTPRVGMDHRVIGERSDVVLRTATPGGDEKRAVAL
jgi:hypothetical protein